LVGPKRWFVFVTVFLLFQASTINLVSPTTVAPTAYPLATAYNSETKIVADPAGNMFVAYTKQGPNGSFWVTVAESADQGVSWHDFGHLPSRANSSRAALAIDHAGRLDLVWTGGVAPKKSGYASSQIYFSSYNGAWSPPLLLSNARYYSGYPSIVVDARGIIRIAWYGFDGLYYQIYYTFYNGSSWSKPTDLTNLSQDSVNPSIAAEPDGSLDVAWYGQYAHYYQVWYASYNGTWGIPQPITQLAGDSLNPSLIIGANGSKFLVWTSEVDGASQVFSLSGTASGWGKPVQLTFNQAQKEDPVQVLSPNGTRYVFWAEGGMIRGCTLRAGCSPFTVYSQGLNSNPSVAWIGNLGIELVWTHSSSAQGASSSVYFTSISSSTPGSSQFYTAAFLAVVAVIMVCFMGTYWLLRKEGIQAPPEDMQAR
jgi:hypothetical protein